VFKASSLPFDPSKNQDLFRLKFAAQRQNGYDFLAKIRSFYGSDKA